MIFGEIYLSDWRLPSVLLFSVYYVQSPEAHYATVPLDVQYFMCPRTLRWFVSIFRIDIDCLGSGIFSGRSSAQHYVFTTRSPDYSRAPGRNSARVEFPVRLIMAGGGGGFARGIIPGELLFFQYNFYIPQYRSIIPAERIGDGFYNKLREARGILNVSGCRHFCRRQMKGWADGGGNSLNEFLSWGRKAPVGVDNNKFITDGVPGNVEGSSGDVGFLRQKFYRNQNRLYKSNNTFVQCAIKWFQI